MATFRFETTATMKPYNSRKWWIDSGIVRPVEIDAADLKTALQLWRDKVENRDYIEISNNALRTKNAMYIDRKDGGDPLQVGYVITGKTTFEDRDSYRSTEQYIDLWVTVYLITRPDFKEV